MTQSSDDSGKKRGMFSRLFGATAPEETPQDRAEPSGADEGETAPGTDAGDPPAQEGAALTATGPQLELEPSSQKQSWFQRLKSGLSKTSSRLSDGITSVFTTQKLDVSTLEELEDLLIQADLGVTTATRITDRIASGRFDKTITPDEVRNILASEVENVLAPVAHPLRVDGTRTPHVILMVGVNGTGKTTTIGKLAAKFRSEGKKVLLAAGDTFRAAAIEQIQVWGERTGATVVARAVGSDAAGLAFDAVQQAKTGGYDVVMIDTAGRLQNKNELMDELEKIVRVIRKMEPDAPHDVLLVLDATTGQNAMAQVEVFRDRAGVTGLIMTKLDGTARGGILVAIAATHELPIHAIGIGEGVEDLQPFDPREFAEAIAAA